MNLTNDDILREERWQHPRLRGPYYSDSLERGLAILTCFTPKKPVLGIVDVVGELGMSHSTVHRYMITLASLGYLEQGKDQKYRLGLRVTDLGMSALSSTDLRQHSEEYLEDLRQRTTYTVSIAVLDGSEIVYVDRAPSFRRWQSKFDQDIRVGSRHPAYATAMGKVLMAYIPGAEQQQLIDGLILRKLGPHTVGSKSALQNELAVVREEGVAVNEEELAAELIAIAVPVYGIKGSNTAVAAIGMSAHTTMISLEEMVAYLVPHLRATADHISARLGYRRNDETRP